MTNQDIVNRVNNYLINYRVNWEQIKYFADAAIDKINDLLGACYPPMSDVMSSGKNTYTLTQDGVDVPIFPERYISSVVVPYIITEVLAKDEEFTTIYNKFATDFDTNLYTMYQNEFNRVPLCFRQRSDVGVFIDTVDLPMRNEHKFNKDVRKEFIIPEHNFTFKVTYSYGTADINASNSQLTLPQVDETYNYGDTYTVIATTVDQPIISVDGCTAYTFKGWSLYNTNDSTKLVTSVTIKGDTTLYAVWDDESTLEFNSSNVLSIKEDYINLITNLVIPTSLDGQRITTIPTAFLGEDTNTSIKTISLPTTLKIIKRAALSTFNGTTINFPKYNALYNAPNITIEADAIALDNITDIYIPKSVAAIDAGAFVIPSGKKVNFYLEHLATNVPDDYHFTTSSGAALSCNIYYGCSDSTRGNY